MISRILSGKLPRGNASMAALAVAMATGSVLTFTAMEAPANAQTRAERQQAQRAERQQAQGQYSEAFVAAYRPVAELLNATPRDAAALRAAAPSIAAAVSTPDDKLAGGQFIYSAGRENSDNAMQLQGLSLMLESGKLPPQSLGEINFVAGQLAFQAQDYGRARTYLMASAQAGYTANDPHLLIAETHFQQNDTAGGLTYLSQQIERQIAAGQTPASEYIRKGLATAYTGNNKAEAIRFAQMFAQYHPSADSWGDAVVVTRSSGDFTDDDMLDLLRLQRATKTFREGREYLSYVEFADPRRLPNEVQQVIDEGYASGMLDRGNTFASEALTTARARQGQLTGDFAGLERDANASGARLATVMAAGNVALDLGQYAKAEGFYRRALTMPGADTATVLNRMGIAQVNQGKYADAVATFNQVEGSRAAVSKLWATYAQQRAGGATGA